MSAITAADFTLFTQIFSKLTTVADEYITAVSVNIMSNIAPAAAICGQIVIAVYGFLLLRGSVQAPLMDSAYRALKLVVILGIALNMGVYQEFFINFFTEAPSEMANVITGAPGTGAGNATSITNFVVAGYNLGDKVWNQGSVLKANFGPMLMAILVWAFTAGLSAYAAFLFALSQIATAILLAVGPIFILLAVFESGKRFFEMWLQQLFNFGLVVVLTAACLQFFLQTIVETTNIATALTDIPMKDVLYFIVFALIDILVLRQVMPIASGLAGGMALSTQGAFGAASNMMGRAMGASVKRYMPNQIAQRRRQIMTNARTNAAWKGFKANQPSVAKSIKGAASRAASAASTAYKNKFQPNKVSKAA